MYSCTFYRVSFICMVSLSFFILIFPKIDLPSTISSRAVLIYMHRSTRLLFHDNPSIFLSKLFLTHRKKNILKNKIPHSIIFFVLCLHSEKNWKIKYWFKSRITRFWKDAIKKAFFRLSIMILQEMCVWFFSFSLAVVVI